MLPAAVISRKRDGHRLAVDEIEAFIAGFTAGEIPDYQMSALAMAICCRGMDAVETFALTRALLDSGDTLARTDAPGRRVDKHSTGGIGDKVSLILAPLLACCGLEVPMLSGRGLGATGGTLDKLESIPGFRAQLSTPDLLRIAERVGCVIAGATEDLVPADRKLYALRDVTGTVPSIPLITASIMSKKLAENLDALVLDVKHGSGAFIKSRSDAEILAASMVAIGTEFGVETSALLTDMHQPLGKMVGNANEVDEALELLAGGGPVDLREVTLALGCELLKSVEAATTPEAARLVLEGHLKSGRAREKFAEMIAAQGGDLDAPRPIAPARPVLSEAAGYVAEIDAEALGLAVIELGGGRRRQGDRIDHSVGLCMEVRLGDVVASRQPLLHVYADAAAYERVAPMLRQAIRLAPEPVAEPILIEWV